MTPCCCHCCCWLLCSCRGCHVGAWSCCASVQAAVLCQDGGEGAAGQNDQDDDDPPAASCFLQRCLKASALSAVNVPDMQWNCCDMAGQSRCIVGHTFDSRSSKPGALCVCVCVLCPVQTYERDGWGEFPTQINPERREIRPTADRWVPCLLQHQLKSCVKQLYMGGHINSSRMSHCFPTVCCVALCCTCLQGAHPAVC